SSRRRHTRFSRDWSSDVCSSDLTGYEVTLGDIYDNPTLYEIYPGLRDIRVFIGHAPSDMSTVKMAYSYEDNLIFINKFYYGEARSEERRVGKECIERR